MRFFSLIALLGAWASGCAENKANDLCYSIVADTLCFEKYAEMTAKSSATDGRYVVRLTLWDGDQITIISDENRHNACEVEENLIFINVGANRLVVSPISWTKPHLDSSLNNVLTMSGESIFAECNFDDVECISPNYDSAAPELIAFCESS